MHIAHSGEDDNLKRMLSSSFAYIKSVCGEFNLSGELDTDLRAKELVFERARYAYNDALEYFDKNFLSDIHTLSFDMLKDDDHATV
ncbi:hypothetical protein [Paucisalibacillus globulus]|uniref:hypothetical protein n=1 Tax=Paucisalibacillus globulus TaxID=351095 RepID=UPI000BB7E52A